jgi:hypothetical protein
MSNLTCSNSVVVSSRYALSLKTNSIIKCWPLLCLFYHLTKGNGYRGQNVVLWRNGYNTRFLKITAYNGVTVSSTMARTLYK